VTRPDAILWPVLAQIAWTMMLYVWLTFARKRAVDRGEVDYSAFLLGRNEPLEVARIARNLANQFELPVIFYATVILLLTLKEVVLFDVIAAWIFVAGRVVHTLVQALTDDVPLRGKVFMINFLAATALAGHLAWLAFAGPGH
jgi:hypothetical protein